MPSRTLATSLSQKMWGRQFMPGFQSRRRASMLCVSSQKRIEAGIVAARFASWRGAKTGSASLTDCGTGELYYMAG